MKNPLKVTVAVVAAFGLSVAPAVSAIAAPWDGNNPYFQHGLWEMSSDSFKFEDIYLTNPANDSDPDTEVYTDIWDGAGEFYISLDSWNNYDSAGATSDADVDVTTEVATGDYVFAAPMNSTGSVWDGQLNVTGEQRIFSAGDLVRSTFFVTNITDAPVTASFSFYTNFGSSGDIYSYQGQNDSVLAVPAAEDETSSDALSAANVQWVVHTDSSDAPGAIAYGLKTADNPGLITIAGDTYDAFYNDVVIPAGATVAFAEFHNWTPDLLIAENYTNSTNPVKQALYATAVTTAAAEFDSFSGRLTNGLMGVNVLNWGNVSTTPVVPELAKTGGDETIGGAVGIVAFAVILAGLGIVAVRRNAKA